MKKIVYTLMAGVMLVACAKQTPVSYTIEGNWPDGNGKVVYLKKDLGDKKYEILDSAIVSDGLFRMQKPLVDVDERILEINGSDNIIILDSVPIQVTCKSIKKDVKGKELETVEIDIKGSIEQDIFNTMLNTQKSEMLIMLGMSLMGKRQDVSAGMQDSLVQTYLTVKANSARTLDSLVENYPDSYAVALIINNILAKQRELPEVEKMYEGLTPRIQNAYLGKKLKTTIEQMRATAVGSIAPDFTLQTPEGTELKLSSFKGKYVLLDFWASWCGPCLREVPNVKNVYDKYHEKGFEILSVSLDDKKDNWTAAIEKHNLNWAHVSSLKGWECPVAGLYHVTGVPAMFLLDKDGKILAKDLRGEELEKQVAALFQ